jgi:hypothetical protein
MSDVVFGLLLSHIQPCAVLEGFGLSTTDPIWTTSKDMSKK